LALAAAAQFDVLVTADQNIEYQQNLHHLPIAIAVLIAQDDTLTTLRALVPKLLAELAAIQPRSLIHIQA
jgi:hypothetical protein